MTTSAAVDVGSLSPSEFVAKENASSWQWRIDTYPELVASVGMLSRRRSKHAFDPRSLQSFEQRLYWVDRALECIQTGNTPEQVKNDLTKEEQLSYELYVNNSRTMLHIFSKAQSLQSVGRSAN